MPSAGIDKYNFHFFFFESFHTLRSNDRGIWLVVGTVKWDAGFGCVLLQLIERSCSVRICANHGNPPSFLLIVVRKFGTRSCFAIALQAHEHHNGAFSLLGLERMFCTTVKHAHQFLVDRPFDDFTFVETACTFGQFHLFLHVVPEGHHLFDVDVCLQQRRAYFLQERVQHFVVDDGVVLHLPQGSRELRSQVAEHHLVRCFCT
mmetsp:Transcript_9737/g.59148  ORF Transcript_9737/g.59148 Transcript_9737/m.59148 type:complete len:204 (+) Transcript_9737:2580-3191(+)